MESPLSAARRVVIKIGSALLVDEQGQTARATLETLLELGALPIVAEDLGFITKDVHALRDGLGLPGMKILQFGFGGDGGHEFLPHTYPVNTVVYTGTHDNDTARGWWDHAPEALRHCAGTHPARPAPSVHCAMIRSAMNSVAALAVFPLQDVLGLGSEHRMNTPGTLGGSNWTWRFHWDDVGSEPGRVLGLLAAASGRGPFAPLGHPAPPACLDEDYLRDDA